MSAFSDRMQDWARKRAVHLADEFAAGDSCECKHAAEFFEVICARELLLDALRFAAEPAFYARLAELEATT